MYKRGREEYWNRFKSLSSMVKSQQIMPNISKSRISNISMLFKDKYKLNIAISVST